MVPRSMWFSMNGVASRQLHELVQSLSASLDVPISVTDERLHVMAHSISAAVGSAQPFFPGRLSLDVGAVAALTEPEVVRGNSAIGLSSILVIPLRPGSSAPRYLLWITCSNGELSSEHIERLRYISDVTMHALDDAEQPATLKWATESVEQAFSEGDRAATDELLDSYISRGNLQHDNAFVCVALSIPDEAGVEMLAGARQERLVSVINRLAEHYPQMRRIIAQTGTTRFALIAPLAKDADDTLPRRLGAKMADLVFRSGPSRRDNPWIVSTSSLAHGSAGEALWQARQGIELSTTFGWKHQVVIWDDISHFRGLATLPTEMLRENFIDPHLECLLMDDAAAPLVGTLRVFLASAGNIQKIAADSYLHRTTVYYRIRQIEERLGVDLSDGNSRLSLHIALIAHDIWARRDGRSISSPP